jgi:hypothetical protein
MAMNMSVSTASCSFILKLNVGRQSKSSRNPDYENEPDPTFFAGPMPHFALETQLLAAVSTLLCTIILCLAVGVMRQEDHYI